MMKIPKPRKIDIPADTLASLARYVYLHPTKKQREEVAAKVISILQVYDLQLAILSDGSAGDTHKKAVRLRKAVNDLRRNINPDWSRFSRFLVAYSAIRPDVWGGFQSFLTGIPASREQLEQSEARHLERLTKDLERLDQTLAVIQDLKGNPGKRVTSEEQTRRVIAGHLKKLFDSILAESPEREEEYRRAPREGLNGRPRNDFSLGRGRQEFINLSLALL